MDGIHDCGGMHGFGKIEVEIDEPCFHGEWEKRVFAMAMAVPFVTGSGDDQFRKHLERIPAVKYITSSYYELWLDGLIGKLKEYNVVDDVELSKGTLINPLPSRFDVGEQAQAEGLIDIVWSGASQSMPKEKNCPHRFTKGDRVRTQDHMSFGHNRLPRYARGKLGTVIAENGNFVFADSNAENYEKNPQMLYTVEFTSHILWGDEVEPDNTVCLDLWDTYLNPV